MFCSSDYQYQLLKLSNLENFKMEELRPSDTIKVSSGVIGKN